MRKTKNSKTSMLKLLAILYCSVIDSPKPPPSILHWMVTYLDGNLLPFPKRQLDSVIMKHVYSM